MSQLNRRHFLGKTLAGAGAVAVAPYASHAAKGGSASDRVELGQTGIKVSRLAMGTGVKGGARESEHTRMGAERCAQLIRHGFDNGLNFMDMADLYGTHQSVRHALEGVKRDDYALLTKLWFRGADWIKPSGGAIEEVDRYCKELGTDYLDVCLIHCVVNDRWTTELAQVRDEMDALKEKGQIRAKGVSCHDFGALKVAVDDPWTDVVFARINHMGGKQYMMDASSEEIAATLKKARANGKAVIGMKIFGEGRIKESEQMDNSVNYVLGNDLVDAMTVGMLKIEEVDDSMARIKKALAA